MHFRSYVGDCAVIRGRLHEEENYLSLCARHRATRTGDVCPTCRSAEENKACDAISVIIMTHSKEFQSQASERSSEVNSHQIRSADSLLYPQTKRLLIIPLEQGGFVFGETSDMHYHLVRFNVMQGDSQVVGVPLKLLSPNVKILVLSCMCVHVFNFMTYKAASERDVQGNETT